MAIHIHPHARERMAERGAQEDEVIKTINQGEQFPAKFGRTGFRNNFPFEDNWRDKFYHTKQVEAYAVRENPSDWLVVTVIIRYF